ncbi:large ribosomal subunit protein mL42-like [Watersipora subatra]|uniref:large ribosomal subunit protein mL42-like n=1 Tax=Watersipora subatra TaxID=2589382 RepID=UPI00355C6B1E
MLKATKDALHLRGAAAFAISRAPSCLVKIYKHTSACQESIPNNIVTTNKKGDVILFWHPERQIPYEHTKPLSSVARLWNSEEDSHLLAKHNPDTSAKYAKYGPTYKELADMFYVTKHRFMPRPQLKRAKTDTPKDRNAL